MVAATLCLAGCGTTSPEESPSTASPVEQYACPSDAVFEGASEEKPFGTLDESCEWHPREGPGWSVEVPCEEMWREGAVLPDFYVGCETPDASNPIARAATCTAHPGVEGKWFYHGLMALEGDTIEKAPAGVTAVPDGDVRC